MKTKKVKEIILPYRPDIPLKPCVSLDDKITEAIRRMIACDVHRIVVIRKSRPIGVVRLEDALKKIGLNMAH
jgi:predicted transcriptional regulator